MKTSKITHLLVIVVISITNAQTPISGRVQIDGNSSPTSGDGIELGYNGNEGFILSYDRDNNIYKPTILNGSTISLKSENSEQIRIDQTGTTILGNLTVGNISPYNNEMNFWNRLVFNSNGVSAINKRFRFTGNGQPTTGKGLEAGYAGSGGFIVSYDRDNNLYLPTRILGSEVSLEYQSIQRLRVDQDGVSVPVGTVSIGTNYVPSGYLLSISGKAIMEEVKVQLANNWPDFVFEPDYELPTLREIKKYIIENKHLPEIPSASDVEKNGIELGTMNALLLKKVEELTLYQIELMERLEKLETENNRIDELEKQIEQLKEN